VATAQVVNPTPEVHNLARKPLPPTNGNGNGLAHVNPMQLLELAVSQDVSIERMQQLMELALRWEANEARKSFVVAMNSFKKNPPAILKSATASMQIKAEKGGGSYSYSYATLDAVCRAVIQGLSEVGISHRWEMVQNPGTNGTIEVTCILTHEAGHSEETSLQGQPDQSGGKNSIQAVGSTVTYLQRYTLLAATGLAASGSDTDGKVQPAANQNTLKPERVEEMIGELRRASNGDQLFRIFKAAYTEASQAGDKAAQDAYINAKDARRKELAHGNR
jgi:hypothetical protein